MCFYSRTVSGDVVEGVASVIADVNMKRKLLSSVLVLRGARGRFGSRTDGIAPFTRCPEQSGSVRIWHTNAYHKHHAVDQRCIVRVS